MKLTKSRLKQLIKEEFQEGLNTRDTNLNRLYDVRGILDAMRKEPENDRLVRSINATIAAMDRVIDEARRYET